MCWLAVLISVLSGAAFIYLALQQGRGQALVSAELNAINSTLTTMATKLSQLSTALTGVESVLTKVAAEIEALKNSVADVDLPADAIASLERLTALATQLDQQIPDDINAGTGVSQV